MLSKNQKSSHANAAENSYILQSDSFFRGHLDFHSPITIRGRFEGTIEGDGRLEIDKGAKVEAFLQATTIVVRGEVVGDIHARDKVELLNGASVIGNIRTPSLEVEEGVIFEGQCESKPQRITPSASK